MWARVAEGYWVSRRSRRACKQKTTDEVLFIFQAEDGIRGLVRSRGLGNVYERQDRNKAPKKKSIRAIRFIPKYAVPVVNGFHV